MRILARLFIIFSFFPFIDLIGIGADSQPNALVLAALLLVTMKDVKVNPPIIMLWVLFFFSLFFIFFNQLSFYLYLKTCFNYLSLPLVTMASYCLFKKYNYKVSYKFFLYTISIYAFVGLVQMYLKPDFMAFIMNQARGVMVHGRGVISLCVEPAFYGSLCLFLMIFSLLNYTKKQNRFLVPFLVFQLLFLSRSATAAAVLGLSLVIYTVIQILRLRLSYILYTAIVLLIAVPLYKSQMDKLEDTRMGQIAAEFIEDPLMVTQIDASVGVRFTGAVAPFLSLRHNSLKPMGLGNYRAFLRNLYTTGKHRNFLNPKVINEKERIGGGMNAVLFQLGFLGLLFPISLFLAFRKRLNEDKYLYSMILFTCLLFTQLQLMMAMTGFTLGFVLYKTSSFRSST